MGRCVQRPNRRGLAGREGCLGVPQYSAALPPPQGLIQVHPDRAGKQCQRATAAWATVSPVEGNKRRILKSQTSGEFAQN